VDKPGGCARSGKRALGLLVEVARVVEKAADWAVGWMRRLRWIDVGRGSGLKEAMDRTVGWRRLQEHEAVEGG
jgi:hypothetical protein